MGFERAQPPQTIERIRIEYDVATSDEMPLAASIYVEHFSHRFRDCFRRKEHAVAFYRDLLELTRRTNDGTFFVARVGGQLAGYIVVMLPGRALVSGLVRGAFGLRVLVQAATGRYGFPHRLALQAARRLAGIRPKWERHGPPHAPHIGVLVVDSAYRGRGIGEALVQHARIACAASYQRMWLLVEARNWVAINLFRRLGWRTSYTDLQRHLMVWEL